MSNSNPSLIPYEQLTAERQIRTKVKAVAADERCFGVLSTGEKIAVAFVLNRHDLIEECWGTLLEAVDRLGDTWTAAALRVQREGF